MAKSKTNKEKVENLEKLVSEISELCTQFRNYAYKQVDTFFTIRNWLIGSHIIEFEQQGEPRAGYGEFILKNLALELKKKRLKGFSHTNLKMFRLFYLTYPQIGQALPDLFGKDEKSQTLSDQFSKDEKSQSLPDQFKVNEKSQTLPDQFEKDKKRKKGKSLPDQFRKDEKGQSLPDLFKNHGIVRFDAAELAIEPNLLINKLSFTHIIEFLKVDAPVKRAFYEIEAIRNNWSVRQLQRAMNSMLFERFGLSTDKESLIKSISDSIPEISGIIKNPFMLEFLDIGEKPEFSENDLENMIISHLQMFIMELGYGFCFEARQKRITFDNTHYYIDLVFYHRILKCHVLIDLKLGEFTHADAGQMNVYLNYFKENIKAKGDKDPIGIILCAGKNEQLVQYATGGLPQKVFVSKYLINLPKVEELKKFIIDEQKKFKR